MSLSNPQAEKIGPKNPAELFIRWKASEGKFTYWDKEKEQEVSIGDKLHFQVLDKLHTVGGFNKAENNGYYANEVRDIKKERLNVFCGKRKIHSGTWGEIKEDRDFTGKYAQSVYVAVIGKESIKLCNLKLEGAAVGAWIAFQNSNGDYKDEPKPDLLKQAVKVTGKSELKKQGRSEWYEPMFKAVQITDELLKEAIEMDRQLQKYLKEYFTGEAEPESKLEREQANKEPEPAMADEGPTDDLPF